MAGRKPLPTHLKLVKGTARPHRMNKAEPQPVVAVPAPPDHLDEEASAKFIEMAEMLARHGVMTELDTGALARYVVIWRRWIEALTVPGEVPDLSDLPSGCVFHPRCPLATERCRIEAPAETRLDTGHRVWCWEHARSRAEGTGAAGPQMPGHATPAVN